MAKTPKQPEASEQPQAPEASEQPETRTATPEEQAQIQAKVQRSRAEVAVLKQRFAETDVAMTIAQAERDQLIQQMRFLQQRITTLEEEVVTLRNPTNDAVEVKEPAPVE